MNDTQLSRVFAPFVVAAAVVIFVVAAAVVIVVVAAAVLLFTQVKPSKKNQLNYLRLS